jgi:hypothetical protein
MRINRLSGLSINLDDFIMKTIEPHPTLSEGDAKGWTVEQLELKVKLLKILKSLNPYDWATV